MFFLWNSLHEVGNLQVSGWLHAPPGSKHPHKIKTTMLIRFMTEPPERTVLLGEKGTRTDIFVAFCCFVNCAKGCSSMESAEPRHCCCNIAITLIDRATGAAWPVQAPTWAGIFPACPDEALPTPIRSRGLPGAPLLALLQGAGANTT